MICSAAFTHRIVLGVFGTPLEVLIEKEASDSNLGASRSSLRVPTFIDDVISAMRQMGAHLTSKS